MISFIVKDFQAIKEAKIKVEGLTLLVGQSNQGKSACFRALYAATNNRFKSNQVRFGEDHAVVKVKYSDDDRVLVVQRSAQGGSPIVKLGDKTFTKLSRTVPLDISTFNNFGALKVGEDGYSLNFHEQFQKPLLLEYSQKKVMDILSASKGIDDLNKVKECLSQKRAENRGAFASVEAILNENNANLSMIKFDINQIEDKITSVKGLLSQLTEIDDTMLLLNDLLFVSNEYSSINHKINIRSKLNECLLFCLENSNKLDCCKSLCRKIDSFSLVNRRIDLIQKASISTEVDYSSKLEELQSLFSLLRSLSALSLQEDNLNRTVDQLQLIVNVVNSQDKVKSDLSSLLLLLNDIDSVASINSRLVELEKFTVEGICPICHNRIK